MSDQAANTLDGASRSSDSQGTQETYEPEFTLLNCQLAEVRRGTLSRCTQAQYEAKPQDFHEGNARELNNLLRKNNWTSRYRTPQQATLDGKYPYTLLNFQLAEVRPIGHWPQDLFDTFKTDRSKTEDWGKMCRTLDTVMRKRRIFPEPQQTQQSVPKTSPSDSRLGPSSPDAWTQATQDPGKSIDGAQRLITDFFKPSAMAANAIASQMSSNASTSVLQESVGGSKNHLDNSDAAKSTVTATSTINHPMQ